MKARAAHPLTRLPPWVGEAWRDVWPAFVASRLLVLVAAALATTVFDIGAPAAGREAALPYLHPFDGWPLGGLFDSLLTPLAKFDSAWYLAIAQDGYDPSTLPANPGIKYAFFPFYPALVRVVSITGGPAATMIAAFVVSAAALLVALMLLHRLCGLDAGRQYQRPAVWLLALAPTAYFFSAPYTESLFLALTLGAVLAARQGHWAVAGLLAAACSATRNTGVVVLLPLVLIYLYGPRADEPAEATPRRHRLLPRYRPRLDMLWLALAPAGLVAFSGYLAAVADDAFAWRESQDIFGRVAVTPFEGAWDGITKGLVVIGDRSESFAAVNFYNLFFFVLAVAAVIGVFRRLPFAYGAYVTAALLIPLSAPAPEEPLRSIPRFLLVLFPLWIWLAMASERRGVTKVVAGVSALGLLALTPAFATWHQVA